MLETKNEYDRISIKLMETSKFLKTIIRKGTIGESKKNPALSCFDIQLDNP
jgi:hypothetical protein